MSDDPLPAILRKDPRYPRAAYDFVREALHATTEGMGANERRHVSARELLEGIRDRGRRAFGPLARTVFESWNVRTTTDFGNIVFNLVDAKEMGKTDDDKPSDFDGVYTFEEAFPAAPGDVAVTEDDEDDI